MSPFPDPAHQTGHAAFPASGFRTRWLMRSPTHNTRKACHGSLRHLRPPATSERFVEVARLTPIARALVPSGLTLELRPLRSTIVTRFNANIGLSDFHPRPARILTDRQLRELLPAHGDGSPVLTREPMARMSTSLPRRLGPVRVLLTSRTNGGLRPFIAGSALALAVSRPARRSLMFQPACSLTPFRGLLHQRLRPGPLPIRAAPVASGWSNNCRVGYLPPTGSTRPFHGAR
jgi:hypothetical protein